MSSPPCSRTVTVQLPDLLSSCSPFELRVNRHCRPVSQASEAWLRETGLRLEWRGLKVGLWAALCYPGADSSQLRLAADFLSLMVYSQEQKIPSDDASRDFELASDRLSRVAFNNPAWYMRFHRSMRTYQDASQHLRNSTCIPDLESYIDLRRDASGFRMVFDLIEYAGGLNLPEHALVHPILKHLTEQACDIMAWSEDAVSCAQGISSNSSPTPNVVTVLMRERKCSLGSALTHTGTLVKQSVESFLVAEREFAACADLATNHDMRRYVRGLRDCIAGTVNWLYETERYLGTKGYQVRSFGWVFVPVLD